MVLLTTAGIAVLLIAIAGGIYRYLSTPRIRVEGPLHANLSEIDGIGLHGIAIQAGGGVPFTFLPKNKTTVSSELSHWLKQAKVANVHLPITSIQWESLGGDPGLPRITFDTTSGKASIQRVMYWTRVSNISAHMNYVPNVVQLTEVHKLEYLYSPSLYNWLSNGKWKAQFKQAHP